MHELSEPEERMPGEILTERLILRRYRPVDAADYLEVCRRNREHLVPFEARNPARQVDSLAEAESLLRHFDADWEAGRAYFLGAWDRSDSRFVAQIYVGVASKSPLPLTLEIGYFVDREREGQGYVSESVRAVLRVAFSDLGAEAVRLECSELNARSRRVAERCGFRLVSVFPRTHPDLSLPDGSPSGDLLYRVTRDEWDRAQHPSAL